MLGNITCACLMGIQAQWLLLAEQTISLGFVFDAYWVQQRRLKIRVQKTSGDSDQTFRD